MRINTWYRHTLSNFAKKINLYSHTCTQSEQCVAKKYRYRLLKGQDEEGHKPHKLKKADQVRSDQGGNNAKNIKIFLLTLLRGGDIENCMFFTLVKMLIIVNYPYNIRTVSYTPVIKK